MRKLLLAATGLIVFVAAPALAADISMPVKAPFMPPPPVFSWTGFYLGVNVGGTWMDNDASYSQAFVTGPNAVNLQSSGIIGGGQIGANWQTGMFVLGVEADIDGRHLNDAATISPFVAAPTSQVTLAQTENWVGTVRGRVGIAQGQVLFYGTGGLAFGDVQHSYTQFVTTNPAQTLGASDSRTATGWAAGGGIEWAFWNNMTLGVEYLHVDLGRTTLALPTATVVAGLRFPASSATFSDQSDIFRVKLNWLFNAGFPLAR